MLYPRYHTSRGNIQRRRSLGMMAPFLSVLLLHMLCGLPIYRKGYFAVGAFSAQRSLHRHSILNPTGVAILNYRSVCSVGQRSKCRTTVLYEQVHQPAPEALKRTLGLREKLQNSWNWTSKVISLSIWHGPTLRRHLSKFTACFLILFSVWFQSVAMRPPSAYAAAASSASTSVLTERLLDKTSPSLAAMIDKYIRQHMFDDDLSLLDPISGTYREAYSDMTTGRYPAALREIVSDSLRGTKFDLAPPTEAVPKLDVGALLTRTIAFLQKRLGLTELAATIVLAIGFVLAGPSLFLFTGMMVGGISKRNMDNVFKKRYGDTYTVDATIKQEPTVEAPPDEEDDEDDESEEDDDEDDEDKDKRKK
jgi:hypothetical protein